MDYTIALKSGSKLLTNAFCSGNGYGSTTVAVESRLREGAIMEPEKKPIRVVSKAKDRLRNKRLRRFEPNDRFFGDISVT